jgi:cytosine/adenosine deaminase-related metal-dependent hydrolase
VIELGMPFALGADWLPSGSVSLLAELQVARRFLEGRGVQLAAKVMVETVTAKAAKIAGLGDYLGRVAPGRPADVLVIERRHPDPYEAVCIADRSAVELVAIGGNLVYGRDAWFETVAPGTATAEPISAWGRVMRLEVSLHRGESIPASLSALRAELLGRYAQSGPIFA